MENNLSEQIYNEYLQKHSLYFEYCKTVERLIKSLLKKKGLSYHSITYRVKDKDSFKKKLNGKLDKYKSLDDITDIAGIRIITYYSDDVDEIAEAIENEFEIDRVNSIDKRKILDPDRFGYLSLHYVAKMDKKRLELPENDLFKECKFEIQIRSILQHAWAEIEHDLGYKSSFDIPREIKRDFYRLAGLLEIGDKEFKQIRNNIDKYTKCVSVKIEKNPQDVLIDKESLKSYIEKSTLLSELNSMIAQNTLSNIIDTPEKMLSNSVKELNMVGFKNIGGIEQSLQENIKKCFELSKRIMDGGSNYGILYSNIGLFYLCYLKIAMSESENKICEYLEENSIGDNTRKEFAGKLLQVYHEISTL